MPRSPTILTPPPGILPFVPNTTIRSQDANALFNDIYQDGNTPRPIAYGGTGANNAQDALTNLGGISQDNFLAAFSIGDGYYSVRDISNIGGVWIKRDGSLYDSADYPQLSVLLPSLPDGVEWTPISIPSGQIYGITATNGQYLVAIRFSSDALVCTSTDGTTFSLTATISSFSVEDILYGNGIYVAVDGNGLICLSTDGITWGTPFSTGVTSEGLAGIGFGNGVFVAVGSGGAIITSIDGSSWTSRTSGVSSLLQSVKYMNNTFVVTGNGGVILTSPDGITWTSRTSGVSTTLNSSAYGDGTYVVVGSSGVILTSTNLTTWTPRSSLTTLSLNDVTYSDSGFMAVGANGVARISTSGIAWSATATGVSATLRAVTFDPARPERYFTGGASSMLQGIRTLPTQFRAPNDSPQYGWIKAEND